VRRLLFPGAQPVTQFVLTMKFTMMTCKLERKLLRYVLTRKHQSETR
jgi:hypothetical protein